MQRQITVEKFNQFDTDNSGFLDYQEFKCALVELALEMNTEPPHDAEVIEMLKQVDQNDDNLVSI